MKGKDEMQETADGSDPVQSCHCALTYPNTFDHHRTFCYLLKLLVFLGDSKKDCHKYLKHPLNTSFQLLNAGYSATTK
jgi:hypothetical protein